MIWWGIIIGIAIGTIGYYLYDRYFGSLVSRIRKLEDRAAALKAKAVADVRKI